MSWNVEDGRVTIKLDCGHVIEATEHDGGVDEVSPVTTAMLVSVARRRIISHAIDGCDRFDAPKAGLADED